MRETRRHELELVFGRRVFRACGGPGLTGLYKTEVIHRRETWRSLEAVEFAPLEWLKRFNNRRALEQIGNTPAEAEQRYHVMLEDQAVAA